MSGRQRVGRFRLLLRLRVQEMMVPSSSLIKQKYFKSTQNIERIYFDISLLYVFKWFVSSVYDSTFSISFQFPNPQNKCGTVL